MSFTFLTNRNPLIFKAALEPLGAREWSNGENYTDLLYFDEYGGKQPPDGLQSKYTLIDRYRTIPLDNKLQLAQTLHKNGLNIPRSYTHPDDVPDEPGAFWYIKDPLSTGGKRIWLCRHHELGEFFQKGYLIQEAILDVALYLGRKFTLRTYVLVCNGIVYWYPDSFLILHGALYQPTVPDPLGHFSHIGYMQTDSEIKLIPSMDYRLYYKFEAPVIEVVQSVFSCFDRELGKHTVNGTYCLFGLDLLICNDGSVVLIEINDRPNFHHTDRVNSTVNQPMLQALCRLLLPDKVSSVKGKQFDELMFFE